MNHLDYFKHETSQIGDLLKVHDNRIVNEEDMHLTVEVVRALDELVPNKSLANSTISLALSQRKNLFKFSTLA